MPYLRRYSASRSISRPRVIKYEMYTQSGLGDTLATDPATLDARVASIQKSAQDYVAMDRDYRRLQIIATLAIPLAAMVTKAIFHWRKGTPLL